MKVKELIKELNTIKDKNKRIVLSSDAEGNNYAFIDRLLERDTELILYPEHENLDI